MIREPVSSSNLVSVGYDSESRTLEVEFKAGATYQYSGVPEAVHAGLMAASSHGAYLNQHVKGRYSYIRVG